MVIEKKLEINNKKKAEIEEKLESKKFPRTSEFLYKKVDAIEEIKQLAGVYQPVEEGDGSMGSNISKTANQISSIMKEYDNIDDVIYGTLKYINECAETHLLNVDNFKIIDVVYDIKLSEEI